MPRLTDRALIRGRLCRDREWSVYALGDLAPGYWDAAEWYGSDGSHDVALIYRAAHPPVLFTCGDPEALALTLEELPAEPELMLSIRPAVLDLVRRRWEVRRPELMWRMLLSGEITQPAGDPLPERLDASSLPLLRELFNDGRATGEEPDYFLPSMLDDGVYYGVRQDGKLAAAAGTHLVVASEGVATIGNVYVRRDKRGRGLGRCVTAAVVQELRRLEIETIALNVRQSNAAAVSVYESLGFRTYCDFYEGRAVME